MSRRARERLARPPPAVCDVHHAAERALGASGRFAPAARRSSGMAHPCPRGCISRPQVHHTRVSRDRGSAPGRRHPRAMDAAPAPDFHRLSGLTSLSGWLPTTLPQGSSHMAATIAPAPRWHQNNLVSTLAAAAFKADLAPRHYRIAPPGDMPWKAPSAVSGRRSGSDGASRLRPPDEHHQGADHRLVGAGQGTACRLCRSLLTPVATRQAPVAAWRRLRPILSVYSFSKP